VGIHVATEHALELEVAHLGLEALRVALDVAGGGLVALGGGELEQLGGLADAAAGARDFGDVGAQAGAFTPELLGAGGVRPESRVLQLARDFLEPLLLAVVLKETPVAKRDARRGL
jgi:hypothetical protein